MALMATAPAAPRGRTFDRSIVEGPIIGAVWKIAWPTVLQNVIGGLQGIIDHAMVGHYVGFSGNAAVGVSYQIFLVVIVFVMAIIMVVPVMLNLTPFFFTVEHQEVHTEAVESRDKHTGQHRKVSKSATSNSREFSRFNNTVFRVEA